MASRRLRRIRRLPARDGSWIRSWAGGFTLIEIMVALAITATGIAAVMKVVGNTAEVAAELEGRIVASWVAGNILTELRLEPRLPSVGGRSGQVKMGGVVWEYRQDIEGTDDPDLFRVDIEVYNDQELDKAPLATVFGYLARPREPGG